MSRAEESSSEEEEMAYLEEETAMTNIPEFDENCFPLRMYKNLTDWEIFSKEQKWIIYLRVNGWSYERISDEWSKCLETILSKEAIATCFKRFANSLRWEKGGQGGSDYYLCKIDLELLKTHAYESAFTEHAFDTESIREEALRLKKQRQEKAVRVLQLLGCDKLSKKEQNTVYKKPHRSWINHIVEEIDVKLEFPILIDGSRFLASTPQHVSSFYDEFGTLIASTPPALIFTADETMLDATFVRKVIIPKMQRKYVTQDFPDVPHITAMCCCNVIGKRFPLFVIIKNRLTLPPELQILTETLEFILCSTSSGWMERWSFLMWTICFIGWFTLYKDSLDSNYADKSGVLIVDGHSSRECPIALELLRAYDIKLITLPGHVTHIMQLFDVGLASPLKNLYSQILKDYIKLRHGLIEGNMTATLRRISVEAIIEAWNKVATIKNIQSSAKAVGLYPYDPTVPLNHQYVRPLTAEEQHLENERNLRARNFLSINNKELTKEANINFIRNSIKDEKDQELCKRLSTFRRMEDLVHSYKVEARTRHVCMMSPMPFIRGKRFDK